MSVQNQIDRINANIARAYDAVQTMGGTLPVTQNTANLPAAIATIPVVTSDYIQLEWIEGTGVQYIDTGITPNDNYIIEMTASNHSNDDTAFFGANDTWNSDRLLCYAIYSRVYFRGSGLYYIPHDVTSSTPYVIRVSSSSFTVNGANNQPQTTLGAVNTTLKFFSGGSRIGKFRFYSAKVWNGNTLVGDYIPVLKKSTCDVGLYDKVSDTFFGNSGNGAFIPGIKIAGYNILDYIQSSGAQYLNTGVAIDNYLNALNIEMVAQYTSTSGTQLNGGYKSGSYYLFGINSSNFQFQCGGSGAQKNVTSANTNKHNFILDSVNKTFYVDSTSTTYTTTLTATNANLSLFARTSSSEVVNYCNMKMYAIKIIGSGNTIRNYIPVQRVSDSKYGLYDLVNDTFNPSSSSTAFTGGNVIIQNDGTSSPYYSTPIVVPSPSAYTGSIANQILRIEENIANAYDVCLQLGRTMPPVENSYYLEPTILDYSFYTITWQNYDGTVLKYETCYWNETPSYDGPTPTRPDDSSYRYTFTGWSPTVAPATADATYTAQYSTEPVYLVQFVNYDNTVLQSGTYIYGETPTYNGLTPSRPSSGTTYYIFNGWSSPIVPVTQSATYTAQYYSYSSSGAGVSTKNITSGGTNYRLFTVTGSTTLQFSEPMTGDIWICGGGAAGTAAESWSKPGPGGGGGFANSVYNSTFETLNITVGGASAATSITGDVTLSARGASGKNGGTGGGGCAYNIYKRDNTVYVTRIAPGTGDGISKIPFGDSTNFKKHCAAGGGGAWGSDNWDGRGGSGGSNGANGGNPRIYGLAVGGAGGDVGGGEGGTANYSDSGCKGYNATFYGSGGGGGAAMESGVNLHYLGAGGNGYQGVCYIRIPLT